MAGPECAVGSAYINNEECDDNTSANFNGSKHDNFQMLKCDIFLIFAQNIDCGYTLEPPQE